MSSKGKTKSLSFQRVGHESTHVVWKGPIYSSSPLLRNHIKELEKENPTFFFLKETIAKMCGA